MSWLRNRMKIFMWITAILFIASFVGGYVLRNFLGVGKRTRYVATVNGEEIPITDFSDMYSRIRDQRQQQNNTALDSKALRELRREAFKQLVDQTIMQQKLSSQGGEATDAEVRQYFLRQKMFRGKDGRINRRRVKQVLQRMSSKKKKQLVQSHRQRIETFRMTRWLGTQVTSHDTEYRRLLREGLRETKLYGVFIQPEHYVSKKRVKQYYEANKSNYGLPPKAQARHILLKPDTASAAGNPLDSIKEDIETIRRRYSAGDSIAKLARQYSDDTKTASDGGLLGWVTPDDVNQSLSNVIFGGQSDTETLSSLVKSDTGYHLVYVEEGPIRKAKPLSRVENEIRSQLVSDTHNSQAENTIKSIHKTIKSAEKPLNKLKEIALTQSHSKFASSRSGYYGWVPTRFVIPRHHKFNSNWKNELSSDNLIVNEISRSLTGLERGQLSEPIKHKFGFHILLIPEKKEPDLNNISDTELMSVRNRLRSTKQQSFTEQWLRKQRRSASIEIQAQKSRIGGDIEWVSN